VADLLSHTGRRVPDGAPRRQVAKARRVLEAAAPFVVECESAAFRAEFGPPAIEGVFFAASALAKVAP